MSRNTYRPIWPYAKTNLTKNREISVLGPRLCTPCLGTYIYSEIKGPD